MLEIIPLILFATLVTISHASFVIFAKKHEKNFHLLKSLWNIHYWANGTLWLLVIAWIIWIQINSKVAEFPFVLQLVGIGLFLLGLYLTLVSFRKLGLKQLLGYRFFSKEEYQWTSLGIYSYLHNPMYDGFVLMLLGMGLWREITADFYGALVAFLLGNIFLASIEKEKTEFKLSELL